MIFIYKKRASSSPLIILKSLGNVENKMANLEKVKILVVGDSGKFNEEKVCCVFRIHGYIKCMR